MNAPRLLRLRPLLGDAQWSALRRFTDAISPEADGFREGVDLTPGAWWFQDHPVGCALLFQFAGAVARALGQLVRPCHCVLRYTTAGHQTLAHTDSPKKVPPFSLLVPLGAADWDFHIEAGGRRHTFNPQPGEGVLFSATQMTHSRPPLAAGHHAHLILTYALSGDTEIRSWEAALAPGERERACEPGWARLNLIAPTLLEPDFVHAGDVRQLLTLAGGDLNWRRGTMLGENGAGVLDDTLRKGLVGALPSADSTGHAVIQRISARLGRPDLGDEDWEIMRYRSGDHFAPHTDYDSRYSPREYTAIVLLQAADSGGELLLGGVAVPLAPGTLVMFPADATHSITEITAGERLSLVGWFSPRGVAGHTLPRPPRPPLPPSPPLPPDAP